MGSLCLLVLCSARVRVESLEIFAVMSWQKPTEFLLCVSVCQALAGVRMPVLWGMGLSGWNPTSSLWESTPIC